VNEPGGTAYRAGRLTESPYCDDLDLFGKTGSAEASRRVTMWCYRVVSQARQPITLMARDDDEFRRRLRDINAEVAENLVITSSADDARVLADLQGRHPGSVIVQRSPAAYWPPVIDEDDEAATHAWFMGFVQRHSPGHGADGPRIAIAVIVEYGGGGPAVAAPIGKDIARFLHDSEHDYLGLAGSPALARSRP
jgi:hypothetical protein